MTDQYAEDIFVVNRWLLRCAGLWPPRNPSKFIQSSYKIYSVTVFLVVNLYFTMTEFVSLFYTYGQVYGFIKNINFFLTHLMGAVKVTFWYFKGHVLVKLMDILESPEFRYNCCEGFRPGEISENYKRTGVRYTVSFFALAIMTLSSSYLPPVIAAISYNGDEGGFDQKLPYYSWMPFDHQTQRTYLLAVAYQVGPMLSYAFSIVAMDTLFINIMNFIAAHFTILQGAFMTSTKRVLGNFPNLHNSRLFAELANREMKKNCHHLQTIFSVCEKLENVYKFLTLGQATATLFILCTCLYLVSTTPTTSKQFYAELVYMVAMGFQLYLYCWFGNEVTLKAKEISMYIWKCDWLLCDAEFKKSMIFTMRRTQKPIYMTVGNFAPLTLETFVAIIKTSYSAFAVIKNASN